jgi:hypothetical protein
MFDSIVRLMKNTETPRVDDDETETFRPVEKAKSSETKRIGGWGGIDFGESEKPKYLSFPKFTDEKPEVERPLPKRETVPVRAMLGSSAPVHGKKPRFEDSLSIAAYDPFRPIIGDTSEPYFGSARFTEVLRRAFADYDKSTDTKLLTSSTDKPSPQVEHKDVKHRAEQVKARLEKMDNPRVEAAIPLLVSGVATARAKDSFSREGLMGATRALDAAAALTQLSDARYEELQGLLEAAESKSERILILKALAARKLRLSSYGDAEAKEAWSELLRYAEIIRGVPPSLLAFRSTLMHVTHQFSSGGAEGCLKQQAANSCVGASTLMAMAEADPFLAWVVNAAGSVDSIEHSSLSTRLQEAIICSDFRQFGATWDFFKSKGMGRTRSIRSDVISALGKFILSETDVRALEELTGRSALKHLGMSVWQLRTAEDWKKLEDILSRLPELHPLASAAWSKIERALALSEKGAEIKKAAFPSLADLIRDAITHASDPEGVDPDHIGTRFLTPFTHLNYERVKYYYRLSEDPAHTERLAQILEAGQDVLIRLGDPDDLPSNYSHCVIMSDVRGEEGKREFMVVDPQGGTANWVSQESFNRSSLSSYYFGESSPVRGVGKRAPGRPEY